MTARVLVVDDNFLNVKLLEAILGAQYFEVTTAMSGAECLDQINRSPPDIVLLDVMMPDLNGFEVCRRIKGNPITAHIPVLMITALDGLNDRIEGLEAGADDFLTKPVDEAALFARVRSLVRLKTTIDEWMLREATGKGIGLGVPDPKLSESNLPGNILLIDDGAGSVAPLSNALVPPHQVAVCQVNEDVMAEIKKGAPDLIIVPLTASHSNGLRLCSQLRSSPEGRHVPILAVGGQQDREKLVQALELGVNDYLSNPIDSSELMARVRTQLRRKRYAESIRQNVFRGLEMAVTDQLTGLNNRRYMDIHLTALVDAAKKTGRSLALAIMDIDFFKRVNDTHGHSVGDEVLKEFSSRIVANIRGGDLACRYGGEEFVVIMPGAGVDVATMISERLRCSLEKIPVMLNVDPFELNITVSIGVAQLEGNDDKAEAILRRADEALYRAKIIGRNRVIANAA